MPNPKRKYRYITTGTTGFGMMVAFWPTLVFFILLLILTDNEEAWPWALIGSFLVLFVAIAMKGAIITRRISASRDQISIITLQNRMRVSGPYIVSTYWSYDFEDMEKHDQSNILLKRNQSASNTIYIWMHIANARASLTEIDSSDNVLVLREKIVLGDKFPNNHKYMAPDVYSRFSFSEVWDVDKVMERLQLQEFKDEGFKSEGLKDEGLNIEGLQDRQRLGEGEDEGVKD